MNKEDFKNQIEALSERWETQQRNEQGDYNSVWDTNAGTRLMEEVDKLQSKSVPINEIFFKPRLIGKTYLIYGDRYFGGVRINHILTGLIQPSKLDFDGFQYYFLTRVGFVGRE